MPKPVEIVSECHARDGVVVGSVATKQDIVLGDEGTGEESGERDRGRDGRRVRWADVAAREGQQSDQRDGSRGAHVVTP